MLITPDASADGDHLSTGEALMPVVTGNVRVTAGNPSRLVPLPDGAPG